jgi:creatinine amidohydrolase/Fe(II)-dependent formamide hydrolase-like protein
METGVGHEFVKPAGAVITTGKGFVRKLLDDFFGSATLAAFVFINGHLGQSSIKTVSLQTLHQ